MASVPVTGGKAAQSAASGTYSSGLACEKCLAKHMMKASIELSEFLEDRSRYEEYALCMGDIACAEDHAKSAGLDNLAEDLRAIRSALDAASQKEVMQLRKFAVDLVKKEITTAQIEKAMAMDKAIEARKKMEQAIRERNPQDASNQ